MRSIKMFFSIIYILWMSFYFRIKWSVWNPWSMGRANLAWTIYTQTPLYQLRVELDKEFKETIPGYKGDLAHEQFIQNNELGMFYDQRTFWQRIALFFAPFSFGDHFKMPLWVITNWLCGIEEEGEE